MPGGLVQVTVNMAASLDGRVAGPGGTPIELSCPEDWDRVHRLRADHDAILVGIGTVLADDPRLTARTDPAPDPPPLRVVLDSKARTPAEANVVDGNAPSLILTATSRLGPIGSAEVEQAGTDRVDIDQAVDRLADRGVTSVLVEGGPSVVHSFLAAGRVDRFHLYLAPRILGVGPSLWEALKGLEADLVPRTRSPLGAGTLLSYGVER